MIKKEYEKISIEIEKFDNNDVTTTSDPVVPIGPDWQAQ